MVRLNKTNINKAKAIFSKVGDSIKKFQDEAPQRKESELTRLKQEVAIQKERLKLKKMKQQSKEELNSFGGF